MDPFDSPPSAPELSSSKLDITARYLHDRLVADGPDKLVSSLVALVDGQFPKAHLNALFELVCAPLI
jgi:hypothetical protein